MEITGPQMILIIILAFVCEYMDSTLGMGYGTTLTPLFMLMGFAPMQIVPAILVSELVSGLLAGILHHREGNVDLKPRNHDYLKVHNLIHPIRYYHSISRSFPLHLKIALLFGLSSMIGAVLAVVVAFNIPKFWLKLYIGILVLSMGILILLFYRRKIPFSIARITGIGLLASFNKALSGGGYGPLVTAGQMLSGIEGKNAVGITSVAEAMTCLIGVVLYWLIPSERISWQLAPYIVIGAVLSVPLSAKSVRIIHPGILKLAIAILTIILGTYTIYKTLAG